MPIKDTEEINYNIEGGGVSDTPVQKPKKHITYAKPTDMIDEAIDILQSGTIAGWETAKDMGSMGLTAIHQINRPYSAVSGALEGAVKGFKEADGREPLPLKGAKAIAGAVAGGVGGAISNTKGLSDVHKEVVKGRSMEGKDPAWFKDMAGAKTKEEQMAVLAKNKPLDIPTPPVTGLTSPMTVAGAETLAPLTEGIGMVIDPLMYGANILGKSARGKALEKMGEESATLGKQFVSGERNLVNAPLIQPILDAVVNAPSKKVAELIQSAASRVKSINPTLYNKIKMVPDEIRRIIFNRTGDEALDSALDTLRTYNDNREQMIAVKAYQMAKEVTDPYRAAIATQRWQQKMPMQYKLRRGGDNNMSGMMFSLNNDVSMTRPYNAAYSAALYGADIKPIENMMPEINRAFQSLDDPAYGIYTGTFEKAKNELGDLIGNHSPEELQSTILRQLKDEDSFLHSFFVSRDAAECMHKPIDKKINKAIPNTVVGNDRKQLTDFIRDEAWNNLNHHDPINQSNFADNLVGVVAEYNERMQRKAMNSAKTLFPNDPNSMEEVVNKRFKPLVLDELPTDAVEYLKTLTPKSLFTTAIESIADSDRYDVIDATLARLSRHKEAKAISGSDTLAEGYERVYNPFGESVFALPSAKANQINKIIGQYSSPPKTDAMQMIDGFNKWMKQSMLTGVVIPRPGFVFRNIISEALKGTQAGAGLKEWSEAYSLLSDFKKTMTPGNVTGTHASQLLKDAIENGVIDTGFIGKEVSEAGSEIFRPKVSYIPVTDDNLAWLERNGERITAGDFSLNTMQDIYNDSKKLTTEDLYGIKDKSGRLTGILKYIMTPITNPGNPLGIRTLAQDTENIARLGTYIKFINEGYLPKAAAKKVAKFSFNYGDVSEELTMLKRLYPFLAFYAKNIPLQISQYFENPRVQRLLGVLAKSGAQTVDLSSMADYEKERIPIKLPGTNKVVYAEDLISTQDVGLLEDMYNVVSGKKTATDVGSKILMSGLHPVKSLFEVMIGTKVPGTSLTGTGGGFSTFTNQPIERFAGERADFIPGVSKKTEHIIKSVVPLVGQTEDWYNAMTKQGRYKDEKYANEDKSLTGIPAVDKLVREVGFKTAKPTEDAEDKTIRNKAREVQQLRGVIRRYYMNDEDAKAEEAEALMEKIIDSMNEDEVIELRGINDSEDTMREPEKEVDKTQNMMYNRPEDPIVEAINVMESGRVEADPIAEAEHILAQEHEEDTMPISNTIDKSYVGDITNHGSRKGTPIDKIVLHSTGSDKAGESSVVNWFKNPSSQVSAHYLITEDGRIIGLVDEDRRAWHAGKANSSSIGIEVQGRTGIKQYNNAQKTALSKLIADIRNRYGNLPLTTHSDFDKVNKGDDPFLPAYRTQALGELEEEILKAVKPVQ